MGADDAKQITDSKKRYAAGMLKCAQMGYRDGDYVPKDAPADILASRVFRQEGDRHAA